jgi:hypothetical protein
MDGSIVLLLLFAAVIAIGGWLWYSHRRRGARRLYRNALERALADGSLSPEEVEELARIREDRDIRPEEVRMVARSIYRRALNAALSDSRLTPEEDESLARLQDQLGLSERDLGGDLETLARLRLLARVEGADLPTVEAPIALVPHEICHWVVQAALAERIGQQRRGRVEIAGLPQRVTGRTPFDPVGRREALRPNEEILPVDLGMFVVTSRRAIFQGARRNVTVPHARLETITLFEDGLRLSEADDNVRGYILVDDAEVTSAILLQAARRRRDEIRPARGRSA